MLVDFTHPPRYCSERFSGCQVECHDNAVSAPVVVLGNGLESFVACCVPDLKLDDLTVQVNRSDFEIDTYRRYVALCELVVLESLISNLAVLTVYLMSKLELPTPALPTSKILIK